LPPGRLLRHGLLFERFLSAGRDGLSDIDPVIEHRRYEEAIQYVYGKYGRDRGAQVANVISCRSRMAPRDAGAFDCFELARRQALWAASAAAKVRSGQPPHHPRTDRPVLPAMTAAQETFADMWASGTFGTHPIAHLRPRLAAAGVTEAAALKTAEPDTAIALAGLVTHCQQPETAGGVASSARKTKPAWST